MLRSGTGTGALIREAEFGQSKADFISKLNIALKEANETGYWISLLNDTEFLDEVQYKSIINDCTELIRMLISSIKAAKKIAK